MPGEHEEGCCGHPVLLLSAMARMQNAALELLFTMEAVLFDQVQRM